MNRFQLPFELANDLPILRRQIDTCANCVFCSHGFNVARIIIYVKHKIYVDILFLPVYRLKLKGVRHGKVIHRGLLE